MGRAARGAAWLAVLCVVACACGSVRENARIIEKKRNDAPFVLRPTQGSQLLVTGSGTKTIAPGSYLARAASEDPLDAAIFVRGARDLVLELGEVEMRGAPAGTALDACRGFGVVLQDCERVTVRGGHLGGYKVCVAAFDCRDLVIEGMRFDGWYGMRLASTPQSEDPADWLWPHENDDDEWMNRYGAAIALNDCVGAVVRKSHGRHGQNGVLLTRSTDCALTDVDFSFLSGWGLALYRSSRNRVAHSRFDYCVRGYSHDVYWRGQDSAGILVFERSCDNVFVENSATHSGDGVFLYGGNDVVKGALQESDPGDHGGSDRNVFFRNDFSFAVANSIEATFSSDNWAIENRLAGSHQHGVWGGYSTRLVLLWNEITDTLGEAISIEHGVDCAIFGNRIEGCDAGLELWWDEDPEFVEGAYGKRHDTSSSGHLVSENRFAKNAKDVDIKGTDDVCFEGNVFQQSTAALSLTSVVVAGDAGRRLEPRALIESSDGALPSGRMHDVSIATEAPRARAALENARAWRAPALPGSLWSYADLRKDEAGLETIVMGEFGPWDFRSGEPRPAQRRSGGLLADTTWRAAWFSWTPDGAANTDPRRDVQVWRALAVAPLHRALVRGITDPFGGSKSVREATPGEHFGLIAHASVDVAEGGRFLLRVTSDDGVRVIVDGETVLENWTWHAPTRDEALVELAAGRHDFTLEYFQIDGASALSIELVRASRP